MFSIKNSTACKVRLIKTAVQTGIGPGSNLFFSNGIVYVNSSNQSVPNLSCIINSTKEKLINDPYDSGRNKPLPTPPCPGSSFIIQINTNNISSGSTANNQFKLPMISNGNYNFTINWGDSVIQKFNGYSNITHTYSSPGTYIIAINGTFEGWVFNNTGDRLKLLDIIQWGSCFRLGNTKGYFYGCSNMNISATDTINLSGTTTLEQCFRDCSIMNSPNLIGWDISNVTNLNELFYQATLFNQPIGVWNTSNVTVMSNVFLGSAFNQPIGSWDTSKVTIMQAMFYQTPFNQDIGSWDLSNITNMSVMFYQATAFNNGGSNSIQNWSAPLCTTFLNMFQGALSFNQPLTNLVNTSGVTGCNMQGIFAGATSFNQNVGSWDVSKAINMAFIFNDATSFNNGGSSSIQNWSAPLCTTFRNMFLVATSFNQPLTNLVNTSGLLDGCDMTGMFRNATLFNQPIGGWDVRNVTNMQLMFFQATSFNQNIGSWNVSKVTAMNSMFGSATAFNNGGSNSIQNWTAPLCTTFLSMFNNASLFNQPLTNLVDTSGVSACSMISMFQSASVFNQNIGGWNVSKVTSMTQMFFLASSFNNGGSNSIQNWSAPLCTSFFATFQSTPFNQPLTNLVDTSGVSGCSMAGMFASTTAFNQNIGGWNVSKVTAMNNMFASATAFNNGGSNSIQNWSVPLCTTFVSMFNGARSFNQPLTNLVNTSGVSSCSLNTMFLGSTTLSSTTIFNNGETGFTSIPNITPSTSSYTNATKVLNCPGATFLTSLSVGDVLIIQTTSLIYSSSIQSITDNTNLILTTAYGSNIGVGTITSINKQIAGTSPLNWDTTNVITMSGVFQYCVFFNQNISKNGSIWNTNKVTSLQNAFLGSSPGGITLFNNGQIITGTTAPMGWTFNVAPTSTNYRTNCKLTTSNKPASLP
jgi:surface protein